MEYIRISAKTVDDAITEASIQLGTSSDNIEYEVVEKGSTGFLGFGSRPAVIMARKKEEAPEENFEEVVETPVKKSRETGSEARTESSCEGARTGRSQSSKRACPQGSSTGKRAGSRETGEGSAG